MTYGGSKRADGLWEQKDCVDPSMVLFLVQSIYLC